MKKYIILTAILTLSLAVSAQRPERKSSAQRSTDRQKSEATTERTRTEGPRTSRESTQATNRNATSVQRSRSDQNRQANRPAETRTVVRENPVRNRTVTRSTTTRTTTDQNNRSSSIQNNRNAVTRPQNENRDNSSRTYDAGVRTRPETEINRSTTRTADRTPDGSKYEAERRAYRTPNRTSVRHPEPVHAVHPRPVEYRRIHYVYREPVHVHVIWTHRMYYDYMRWYPDYHYWYYPIGYRIMTVSAYDAAYHIGEVANIYGIVHQAWYSPETDEYFLYFGAAYPYQDFTVIIPGRKARRFSHRPEQFFQGRHIWVTGLVSLYEDKPEMVIKRTSQIHLY